jgi:hypothetical protein
MREDPNMQPWQEAQLEVEHCTNSYLLAAPEAELKLLRAQAEQWWLNARSTGLVRADQHGWDLFNVGHVLSMGVERLDDPEVFKDDEEALAHVIRVHHDLDSCGAARRVAGCAILLHQLANEARRRAWGNGWHNNRTPPSPGQKPPVGFQPDYPDEITAEQLDAIQKLAYKYGVPTLRKLGEPGW